MQGDNIQPPLAGFINSSIISQAEVAFQMVQRQETVRRGEEMLRGLRKSRDLDLALAMLLRSAKSHHCRLLAALELEKMGQLAEETGVHLREVYFRDSHRLAAIIANIVSRRENIHLVASFLQLSPSCSSLTQRARLAELLFEILSSPEKAEPCVVKYEQVMKEVWRDWAGVVNGEVGQMWAICYGLFIQTLKNTSRRGLWQNNWDTVKRVGSFRVTGLRASTLSSLIENNSFPRLSRGQLGQFFEQVWRSIRRNDECRLKLLGYVMGWLVQLDVWCHRQHVDEFIEAANHHNYANQEEKMISVQQGEPLASFAHPSSPQPWELILDELITKLLHQHYTFLRQQYADAPSGPIKFINNMLPLFNHQIIPCDPTFITPIATLIFEHFQSALESHIHHPLSTASVVQMLTYLEFFAKQHTQVPPQLIARLAILIGKLAVRQPQLTECAYSFTEEVASTLSTLDTSHLVDFLQQHLKLLNCNEWGHKPIHYQCFLLTSRNLEERQQMLTKRQVKPGLLTSMFKSFEILLQLLSKPDQAQLQIIGLSLQVMSYLLKNPELLVTSVSIQTLNLEEWCGLVDKYSLYDCHSATVVAVFSLRNHSLLQGLQQEPDFSLSDKDAEQAHFLLTLYYESVQLAQIHHNVSSLQTQLYLNRIRRSLEKWMSQAQTEDTIILKSKLMAQGPPLRI